MVEINLPMPDDAPIMSIIFLSMSSFYGLEFI